MFAAATVATRRRILAASAAAAVAVAVIAGLSYVPTGAAEPPGSTEPKARSAKEVRGATPYAAIKDEPAPKLIVDPPLPDLLAQGVVWIQWRVENVRILPVFGKGALDVSPRVGHLHIHVDDLPWWWADASDNNTIDLAGVPPGEHKVLIELVNADHQVFPGQAKTVTFTVPGTASHAH
jgi:hypothetical protein